METFELLCVFHSNLSDTLIMSVSKHRRGLLRAVPLPKGFALTINLPWKKGVKKSQLLQWSLALFTLANCSFFMCLAN